MESSVNPITNAANTVQPLKLLLVIPNIAGKIGSPPYNVALLKAFIDQRTIHSCDYCDLTFHKENWQEYLRTTLTRGEYDLVGLSVLSFEYNEALQISTFIKSVGAFKIIWGGVHVTLTASQCIQHQQIDFCCIGDGEYTLKELLDNQLNPEQIQGLVYRQNDTVVRNADRILISNLDELPAPDWSGYDLERYWMFNNNHLTLMVSRGCPYKCTYCNNAALQKVTTGQYVRYRSVDNVMDEIDATIRQYHGRGFLYIQFIDDIFILNKKWVREFCQKYKQRGYDRIIKWMISVRANLVTEELMQACADAGCYEAGMGIESANDYIRNDVYKRNMSNEQIVSAVEIIKKVGMLTRFQFIIGAPYETIAMMEESLSMAKILDGDVVMFSLLMPLPGTEIEALAQAEGLLESQKMIAQDMYSEPKLHSKYITAAEIKQFYGKVRAYQIKKYLMVGLKERGVLFLFDLLAFLLYYKPKYKLDIQSAYKFTIKQYLLKKQHARTALAISSR